MAAGTMVSRLSGFLRSALLVAALGSALHADVFNIANTLPNMLYILLAGGIFNAVLVPQLVRSMKDDADGGAAYTNRVITLAALFLGAVSILLVAAAPLVMGLFLDPVFDDVRLSAQRDSVIAFARLCLPQVFFYGMFVLVGQILNARGRFGPMMWAPIANNVISIAVLVTYLVAFGTAQDPCGGFTDRQILLLGLGSTIGIAVQFAILVPYVRATGFTFRPRFDFRDAELGHTLRLGLWTVLFVVVNQIAYTVVVRLASSGTAQAALADGACSLTTPGTGYTVYSQSFLIMMVPHSVITVSLATAILPALSRRAAEADLRGVGSALGETLRTALVVIVPFVALLPVVALGLSRLLWGYGAADYRSFAPTLALFGPGLLFFTVHYLMLRGFYALERTRTVFFIQCAVAVTNILVAIALVRAATPAKVAPALVVAYTAAYAVGSVVSWTVLRRLLGGAPGSLTVGFVARLLAATAAAAIPAYLIAQLLDAVTGSEPTRWMSLAELGIVGVLGVVTYVLVARFVGLGEVRAITDTLTDRLPHPLRNRKSG
jgi:putative peptidoglycan lipid II flippase